MGYVLYWGYNPFTNLLLSSWHIQVQAAPPLLSSPPRLFSSQDEFALNFCKLAQIKKTNKVWNLSAWFRLVSYNHPCYLSCKCIGDEVLPEPELRWSWVFFVFFFQSFTWNQPLNIHFKTVGYQFGDSKSLHDKMEKTNPFFETSGKLTQHCAMKKPGWFRARVSRGIHYPVPWGSWYAMIRIPI